MGFTPRAGIAILQLIFYIPALIIGVNYGRKKQTAWLDLSLLALTRIVGCSCLLANSKYNLYGLRAVAIIAEAIAVLFVVFLILDLLERLNTTPSRQTTVTPHLSLLYFSVPGYLTWAGMGVSLAGYLVVSRRKGDALLPTGYTKAGTGINIALYAWTVLIFILLWQRHRIASGLKKSDEVRQLVVGVARCLPLVGVRMVYSLIFVATMNKRLWHPLVGKWAVYFFMAALPELVVLAFVIATLVRIPAGTKTVVPEVRDEVGMNELPELKRSVSNSSSVTAVAVAV